MPAGVRTGLELADTAVRGLAGERSGSDRLGEGNARITETGVAVVPSPESACGVSGNRRSRDFGVTVPEGGHGAPAIGGRVGQPWFQGQDGPRGWHA